MNTLIHIGYPKTGSSWFQKEFLPGVTNAYIIPRKVIQSCFILPTAFEFDADKCRQLIKTSEHKHLVLSEEILLGRLRPGGVKGFVAKEIALRLHQVFPDGQIILFIRNQIDILASSYIQYVRSGGNYGIDRFLFPANYGIGQANELVVSGLDYYLYHHIIDFYTGLFGKENVHVYLYEEFAENPSRFISQLASKFDLNCDMDEINFNPAHVRFRKNIIRLQKFCAAFSRKGPLNKYYIAHIPYFEYLSRKIIRRLDKCSLFGKRPRSEDVIGIKRLDEVMDYYRTSNRILIDKFGLETIKKYKYPL